MRRPKGFTLTELLVGMFLLALLLTVTLTLFLPQMKLSSITRNISAAQQDALNAHRDLTRDLSQTNVLTITNDTNNFSADGLSGPAVAFSIAFDGQNSYYAAAPTPPAPSPEPSDPLTDALIPEVVPAWSTFVVYFVDGSHKLWRVTWPACGCTSSGLRLCGAQPSTVACGDLSTTSAVVGAGSPPPTLYYSRISASALSNYAKATGLPSGTNLQPLASGVLDLEMFSGDTTQTTKTPTLNPLEVVLLVKRTYGEYNPANPSPTLPPRVTSPNAGTIQGGDTIMTLDSSVNAQIGASY